MTDLIPIVIPMEVETSQVEIPMEVAVSEVEIPMELALSYRVVAGQVYRGETTVDPKVFQSVTLETNGLIMPDNVTVYPIRILDVDNPAGGYTITIGTI